MVVRGRLYIGVLLKCVIKLLAATCRVSYQLPHFYSVVVMLFNFHTILANKVYIEA